jgi:ribonuclease BN (tRNA processing enzyme)
MEGCDVLVAECALPEPAPFEGHLTPTSLAEMANAARPGLLLATHVYPPLEPETAVALVREAYSGPTEAAADGMVLSWTDGIVAVDRPAGRE